MDTNIFEITEEGELDIKKPECRAIPEFKKLISRDKGSEGDHDGRKKKKAFAELLYIYLVHSPVSIFVNLPEQKRRELAQANVGLEESWKPDKYIKAAEEKYVSLLSYTGTYNSLIVANRSLYSISNDLDLLYEYKNKLKNKLQDIQNSILTTSEDDPEFKKLEDKENVLVDRIISVNSKLQGIASKIPDGVEIINKLKEQVANEKEKESTLKGGGELGNREV